MSEGKAAGLVILYIVAAALIFGGLLAGCFWCVPGCVKRFRLDDDFQGAPKLMEVSVCSCTQKSGHCNIVCFVINLINNK